jgi:catechol 2,3-dioxygenase-like lactoylglutathione lyase family enzyme
MDLARVIIFTGDVRRMVDFYTSTFGLEIVGEFDPGWTEMDAGGCKIAFHKVPFEVDSSSDNGVKIVFASDNVAGEKARLEGLGIEMTEIFRYGDIEMCDGSDPDGHRFQISSRGV